MSFCREIDDGVEPVLFEKRLDLRGLGDISTNESVTRVRSHLGEVEQIPGVCQKVVINDLDIITGPQDVSNKAGTDESGPSCNKNFHSNLP
jgi:hypothetical protein